MIRAGSVAALDCFLIADDLTGACDAAVHFAMHGYRTSVPVAPGARLAGAAVIAMNTESRNLVPAAARDAVAAAAASLPLGPAAILFKKIDSTLRGSIGAEITAALAAFACDAALVCPALPRMSRIVDMGRLQIAGAADFAPIEVAVRLRAQGVERCVHAGLQTVAAAIRSGGRVIVLDAGSDVDLDQIAAEGLALDCRVLWAGSAGLAAALARRLPGKAPTGPRIGHRGPALFCIGSGHRATIAQQTALVSQRRALLVDAGPASAECLKAALGRGQHVVLRIPPGNHSAEWLQERVAGVRASALVLSGGDTASLFCRAAAVQRIDLFEEIIAGVPCGVIRGGPFDGISVATKSGGFGDPDALIQIADFFHA